MKSYITTIAIVLLIVTGISFILYKQHKSLETLSDICATNHLVSLWSYNKPGRIFTNTNFCTDPKTHIVYFYLEKGN